MKTILKSVLCVVIILSFCLTLFPNVTLHAEAASTGLTLTQLRQKFPHGKYWNHAGNPGSSNSVNNQDGYTSTPCSQHGVVGTSKQTCNGFQPSGTQLSWQCMGYAEKLGYDATGYNPRSNSNGWYTYTSSSALDNLKPGDIVRYKNDGHSIYVIGVNGDTVTYTDCNSDGHCIIRWGATISKSTLRSTFTHVRSAPFAVTQGSTSCSCSSSYAGTYVCTTTTYTLTIRSGHGTSYAAIGSIPPGASVTVTKASGSSSSDWAHVEYNGVTGYASMEYLSKQSSSSDVAAKISRWISYEEMGESITSAKQGDYVYLCYKMYDANTGKLLNELAPNHEYTVSLKFYNPDGTVRLSNQVTTIDNSYIRMRLYEAGTYTYEIKVEGDWSGTYTGSLVVAENPKQVHVSTNTVNLTLGGTSTTDISVWGSGYYNGSYTYTWTRSNSNVSCSWGDWQDDGTCPLTLSANSEGTTQITVSIKDKDTGKILDSAIVTVTISAKNYTVSYSANGGTGAPSGQSKVYGTALTLSSTIPTRFGYNFVGWATSSSATSASYQPGGSYSSNSNVTLYAVWQQATSLSTTTSTSATATINYGGVGKYYKFTPSVTTSYRIYGTGSVDNKVVLYNSSGTQLATDDDSGEGTQFQLDYTLTSGQTYYIYVRLYSSSNTGSVPFCISRGYTVTYNANNGSGAPAATYKYYGTTLTLSSTKPTRTGYTFQGWATSSSATSATYQPGGSFSTNANTTLYAVWKANTYTVSYNANGGSGAPGSQSKTHGTALTLSSTRPTRTGYTFQGWATSSTATSAAYQPGGSFSTNANTTLYAVWKANTYTVSYNANGGSGAPGSQTKTHGTALTLSSNKPTRTGYTFLGWATSSTATSAAYQPGGSFTTNANTTLYAVWKKGCEGGSHSYNYTTTKAPTTSATGTLTGTCSKCSGTTTVTLPKLDTTSYTYSVTKAATCTANGTGRYTWKTTSYGNFYFAVTINSLGHNYSSGSCTRCGATDPNYVVNPSTSQIVVSSATAEAGKTVTVTLSLKNNPGISGLAVSLDFDEAVFTLKEVQNGNLFGAFTSGKNYIWDESENVTEDGVLATFVFEISAGTKPGRYSIGVISRSCVNSELESVALSPIDGTVTVTDILYGDANGDGEVDMKDVVLLRKYMANYDYDTGTSSVTVYPGADANGDGSVDMKDVVLLRKYMANYDYDTGSSTVILGPK